MKWHNCDLCYCQNIHPGETWADNLQAIREHALAVRDLICPDKPFGLGLRLSAVAARQLSGEIEAFKEFLARENFYVFTINGFPYGRFHGGPVKERVYRPDWAAAERLHYTIQLADILTALLPDGRAGSISTVPITYGKSLPAGARENFAAMAEYLAGLHASTGKKIILGLEPEPDCLLETTAETIAFIKELQEVYNDCAQYIGVCLDTCHMAVQQEDPLQSLKSFLAAGVPIAKLQLSAALRYDYSGRDENILIDWQDPVYLHQTRVVGSEATKCFPDLPVALQANPTGRWLVHYHVPLYYNSTEPDSTADLLTGAFFDFLKNKPLHLEIETYSLARMPGILPDFIESIAREYRFVFGFENS